MHKLLGTTIALGATLKSTRSGQIMLQPSGFLHLELVRRGDQVVKGEVITIEIEHPDDLDNLADTLKGAAAELRRVVAPLTQTMHVPHNQAHEMGRQLIEFLKDPDGNQAEIEVLERSLVSAGWDPLVLVENLSSEAPSFHPDGCGCPGDKPDLGTPPGPDAFGRWAGQVGAALAVKANAGAEFDARLVTSANLRGYYDRGLGIAEAVDTFLEDAASGKLAFLVAAEETAPGDVGNTLVVSATQLVTVTAWCIEGDEDDRVILMGDKEGTREKAQEHLLGNDPQEDRRITWLQTFQMPQGEYEALGEYPYGRATAPQEQDQARPQQEQQQQQQEQQEGDAGEYEWITADVDIEGDLVWRYRAKGASVDGNMSHDEDVSAWEDSEIIDLTISTLSVPEHQRDLIKVERE